MTFEHRVRTYLRLKAATIVVPPRPLAAFLKEVQLGEALDDLRSLGGLEERRPRRQRWWRSN